MCIAYRTLALRFELPKEILHEVEGQDARLRALTNLAVRGYEVHPPDLKRTVLTTLYMRNFVKSFEFGKLPKRWFCRAPIPCTVLRVVDGIRRGDTSAPIAVDLDEQIIRVRYLFGRSLEFELNKHQVRWIRERLSEGADVKFASVYVKNGRLCVALTFERKVPSGNSANVLVIDINSWKHGIVWSLIKGDVLVSRGCERPNLRDVDTWYRRAIRLGRKYGKLKRLELHESAEGKKLWRQIKVERNKIYRYLKDYENKLVRKFTVKALRNNAKIVIDYVREQSRRELLEEKLPSGLVKLYLLLLSRFAKLLVSQARWYGIPIEFRRLPSTICPRCGSELKPLKSRTMCCEKCGFRANRDEVPIHWALRLVANNASHLRP